jgi:protein-S-isoprenylcysteine O-methyltransferase Ste14
MERLFQRPIIVQKPPQRTRWGAVTIRIVQLLVVSLLVVPNTTTANNLIIAILIIVCSIGVVLCVLLMEGRERRRSWWHRNALNARGSFKITLRVGDFPLPRSR